MEYGNTKTSDGELTCFHLQTLSVEERLETLLKANAAIANHKMRFPKERDEFEALSMRRPIGCERTFSLFGAMLGSLVPASIFLSYIFAKNANGEEFWPSLIMSVTTFVCAVVGFYSGTLVGKAVRTIENLAFATKLLALIVIGLLWGMASGGAGGLFIFLIGAFFGAIIGGVVGAVALPAFALPYFALSKGGMIDLRHFLPLSMGTTLSICAYVFGFLFR